MANSKDSAVEAFRQAIAKFGTVHPGSIRRYKRGQRVISQGAVAEECFLIKEGTVSILVQPEGDGAETQVALRFQGDLVGETAFLQRNVARTASVEVVSSDAVLIRLTRNDVFSLLRDDPALHDAITLLWELAAGRQAETSQVLQGQITVVNQVMSVMLGDIHNFSALGEATWEEQSNAFLYEFIETAHDIAIDHGASFEDQGDGFRLLFQVANHAEQAVVCASAIATEFEGLRDTWRRRNDAFSDIGLGVGICTDCISVRKREGSPRPEGRFLSHAINVAASMSKCRTVPSDVDIFVDENTRAMVGESHSVSGPHQKWLEKLGRIFRLYRVEGRPSGVSHSKESVVDGVGRAMGASGALPATGSHSVTVSILFLAADPSDATRLRLAEEAREIQEKLKLSKYRERFSFHQRGAVRPEDISQALLDAEPQIVHFSGHGSESGELCFEDRLGKTHAVSAGSLGTLFKEFSETVGCVVLNACFSETQANAIVRHVDYVIGMDRAISDSAALAFAVGMYQAIGAGKTIEEAYRLGCAQIGLQHGVEDESLTPILKSRDHGRAAD